jgi:hypothetical protein
MLLSLLLLPVVLGAITDTKALGGSGGTSEEHSGPHSVSFESEIESSSSEEESTSEEVLDEAKLQENIIKGAQLLSVMFDEPDLVKMRKWKKITFKKFSEYIPKRLNMAPDSDTDSKAVFRYVPLLALTMTRTPESAIKKMRKVLFLAPHSAGRLGRLVEETDAFRKSFNEPITIVSNDLASQVYIQILASKTKEPREYNEFIPFVEKLIKKMKKGIRVGRRPKKDRKIKKETKPKALKRTSTRKRLSRSPSKKLSTPTRKGITRKTTDHKMSTPATAPSIPTMASPPELTEFAQKRSSFREGRSRSSSVISRASLVEQEKDEEKKAKRATLVLDEE